MSETTAGVIFFVTVAVIVLPIALSQMGRQSQMAKKRGWLDAATPGSVLPSKRSQLIGLTIAAAWLVISISGRTNRQPLKEILRRPKNIRSGDLRRQHVIGGQVGGS